MGRRVVYGELGDTDSLEVEVGADPHPGPGGVRGVVSFAGPNPFDCEILASGGTGGTGGGAALPSGDRTASSGTVDEVGRAVRPLSEGDLAFGGRGGDPRGRPALPGRPGHRGERGRVHRLGPRPGPLRDAHRRLAGGHLRRKALLRAVRRVGTADLIWESGPSSPRRVRGWPSCPPSGSPSGAGGPSSAAEQGLGSGAGGGRGPRGRPRP